MTLTKREQIAAMAMSSIIHTSSQVETDGDLRLLHPNKIAKASVEYTDALIAELDRTAPKCEHENRLRFDEGGVTTSNRCHKCGELV